MRSEDNTQKQNEYWKYFKTYGIYFHHNIKYLYSYNLSKPEKSLTLSL